MDQEVLRELLDEDAKRRGGDPGILVHEIRRQEEFFDRLSCEFCGGSCRPVLVPEKIFTSENLLPNSQAECNDCGAQFTPYTDIIIREPTKDPLEPD